MPAPLRVVEVKAPRERRDFLHLPARIHADDPAWVPPLLLEQKQRVFENAPLFAHCEVAAFVAYRDGVPVGRITAQLDSLQPEAEGKRLGYFGMIEAEDSADVFAALVDAARDWLRARGAQRMRGPYNLSINEEIGLLVDGFDTAPFILMGHAARHYAPRLEEQGLTPVKDLLTYMVAPDFEAPAVMTKLAERASRRVTIRPLNRRDKAADFEAMRDIFNDAWADNWGFVPFTRAEFAETAKLLSLLLPEDFIQFAEIEGEPVAFIAAFPNLNEAPRTWRAAVAVGLGETALAAQDPRHAQRARGPDGRAQGAPELAARPDAGLSGDRRGAPRDDQTRRRGVEMGWILEDNDGMRHIIEEIGSTIHKRYRIYESDL